MEETAQMVHLVLRQAASGGALDNSTQQNSTVLQTDTNTPGNCSGDNEYDGRIGLRVSAIFVILVGSFLGACFPVYSKRNAGVRMPEWLFFGAKYFGSGVIVATAFIHLLAPANDALTNPCLTGPITEYDWVEGIALMTIFWLFFAELMTMRLATFGKQDGHKHSHTHDIESDIGHAAVPFTDRQTTKTSSPDAAESLKGDSDLSTTDHSGNALVRGEDHLGHRRDHVDNTDIDEEHDVGAESYAAQMTAIFILEFGVIFHSIFIGLTLAVAGSEFDTLYVVLVFHQTFEGLGLGTRLATAPWPKSKRWTPYYLAAGYALSTPTATAVGLGVRKLYQPGSQTALITNGVFDSISAGILIYTGLVELMAHEFMFSPTMQRANIGTVLSAFGLMCFGAGVMALLGKWA